MKKPIPHLLIVSWAFIVIGLLALIRTMDSLFHSSRPSIDFLLVFLLIGIGLLRRSAQARTFAIICCAVQLIFNIAALTLLVAGKKSLSAAGSGSQVLFWITTITSIAACAYGLWVLQIRTARSKFGS